MIFNAIIAVLMLIAGWGAHDVWRDRPDATIYGTEIDRSLPWGLGACSDISEYVEFGHVVREAGGRKESFMKFVIYRANTGENEFSGQVIREISDAWDKNLTGEQFVDACIREMIEWQIRKRSEKRT